MDDGLVTLISRRCVPDIVDALAAAVEKAGMTVFARIDHAANAAAVGLTLRPTELLIFGNPTSGTVLMQDEQTAGLDLPMHALAWEDENGEYWLTYNDPAWVARRHDLGPKSSVMLHAIETGMATIARAATGN